MQGVTSVSDLSQTFPQAHSQLPVSAYFDELAEQYNAWCRWRVQLYSELHPFRRGVFLRSARIITAFFAAAPPAVADHPTPRAAEMPHRCLRLFRNARGPCCSAAGSWRCLAAADAFRHRATEVDGASDRCLKP